MDMAVTMGAAAVALGLGLVIGWAIARGRAGAMAERAERAERAAKDEAARAQAAVAAAQAQAKRDVATLQTEMASRIERLGAEHRAEQEKLARHLTEAYDELEKLRLQSGSAGASRGPDTGQGFPATMPMGDL
jgi:uncharacterized protein YlxW (UPF0749 family)